MLIRNLSSQHFWKIVARTILGVVFVLGGIAHFTASETELKLIPPFLPLRREALYITGVFESLGGLGLFAPSVKVRRTSAWGLVALLVIIFPANVYQAVANIQLGGFMSTRAYQWGRLPFQAVFILWALWCTSDNTIEKK